MCSTKEPKRRRWTSPMGSPIRIFALAFTIDPTVGERHGDRVAERDPRPQQVRPVPIRTAGTLGRAVGSPIGAELDDEVGLVGARGFEPPTSSSRTMRATKLRHAPTEGARLQGLRMIAQTGRYSETGDARQTY